MDSNEAPKILDGQTSIEDMFEDPTAARVDASPPQGCLTVPEDEARARGVQPSQ